MIYTKDENTKLFQLGAVLPLQITFPLSLMILSRATSPRQRPFTNVPVQEIIVRGQQLLPYITSYICADNF